MKILFLLLLHASAIYAYDESPFLRAAYLNQYDVVKSLLASGANINEVDDRGQNALIKSASWPSQDTETLNLLILNGIDKDVQDSDGFSALHWALSAHSKPKARLLIESGINVDLQSVTRRTALMDSLHLDYLDDEIRSLMIAKAKNFELRAREGTVLFYAMIEANELIAMELVKAGANVNALQVLSDPCTSVLDYAKTRGGLSKRFIDFLIKKGAKDCSQFND